MRSLNCEVAERLVMDRPEARYGKLFLPAASMSASSSWTCPVYVPVDLPPEAPSFITRVCGSEFHIPPFRFGLIIRRWRYALLRV